MRKLLSLLLVAGMASSSFAQFSPTSMRMNGINPNLVGIITDEYSDALSVNSADTLNIKGWRAYTNLSNIYGSDLGADQAFNDNPPAGAAGVSTFLLGGFGNPFKKFLSGQMGLFYDTTRSMITDDGAIPNGLLNAMGDEGESCNEIVSEYDNNPNGAFNDAGDARFTSRETAKRYLDSGYSSLSALYARQTNLLGNLKMGVNVSHMSAVDGNGGLLYSSEEPIDGTFSGTTLTYGTPNTTTTEDQNQVAKETYKNSTINIGFGGRHEVNNKWDIGATLNFKPVNINQSRDSRVSFILNNTAGAANPLTAEETMANGDQYIAMGGAFPVTNTGIRNGYDWSTNNSGSLIGVQQQAMGPNGEMYISGYTTGDEIGSYKAYGNEIGLSADTHYDLTNMVRLVGRIHFNTLPGKLDASMSLPFYQRLQGGGTAVGWGGVGATDTTVADEQTDYDISGGKYTSDSIGFVTGAEAKLKQNVLLGFGLSYSIDSDETKYNWQQTCTSVYTYDNDSDGFSNSAGNGDERRTYTDVNSGSSKQRTETTVMQIPIGFELLPWPKFPIRLGVTHQIAKTKTINQTNTARDGQEQLVREWNATTVTSYTGVGGGLPERTGDEYTITTTNITSSTRFYYGMGYKWSENLTFDILGIASGTNVLDLNDWRIGATLVF